MASITYTALRDLEPTGFAKGGSDISVAAGDDSFNAAVTSLLGLTNAQWILVAGFANSVNNGWFQVSGSSTAAKILQSTTSSLVTEGAGPAATIIDYQRGFGQGYFMDFNLEMATYGSQAKRQLHQPLGGGAPEVVFWRNEKVIRCKTSPIAEASLLQWREFLGSVSGGEVFSFDRYGTNAAPVELKNAMMQSDSWEEEREGSIYPGRYRISFDVRLLS